MLVCEISKFWTVGFSESDCEHPNFIIVPESPAQTTCPPQFSSFFTSETFFSKTRCIASGRKSTGGHWVSRGGRLFSYWPEIRNQCVRIPYSPCSSNVPSPLNPFSAFCGRKVVTLCPGVVKIKFSTPDSESWGYFTLIWCIIRHICEKPHFDDSSTNRKPETSTNPNFFESLQFSVIKGSF